MARLRRSLRWYFLISTAIAGAVLIAIGWRSGWRPGQVDLALGLAATATGPALLALYGLFGDIRVSLARARRGWATNYYGWLDSLPHGVVETDLQGRVSFCSDAARSLLGLEPEPGRPIWSLVTPVDATTLREGLVALASGRLASFSLIATSATTAEPRQLRFDWVRRPTSGLAAVVIDVTEQERDRLRLQESETRYRSLFEHSIDGVLLIDGELRILAANPAACRLLGYSEAQLRRLTGSDVFDLDHAAFEAARRSFEQGRSFRGEHACRRADGSLFPVELGSAHFLAPDGEKRVSIVFRDITMRKASERRRRQDEIKLRRKQEELQRLTLFLHSVREQEQRRISQELHDELGQLITAARFDLDQLSRRLQQAELEEPLSRLDELIGGMIQAVRRIARGLRPPLLDEVGLVAACHWQIEDFGRRVGLDCRFLPDRDEYELSEAVATAVFRIVQEALTNVARHAQAEIVQVSLRQSARGLELQIEDDGRGMDLAVAFGGDTYGLLGMRERAQMLGGSLQVSSRPGQGTRVRACIPLADRLERSTRDVS